MKVAVIAACMMMAAAVASAVPMITHHQGHLLDNSGQQVNGIVNIEFRLFGQSAGGTALWTETHTGVAVQNGLYSVLLGGVEPLADGIFNEAELWLETAVGGETLAPRTRVSSVPYAVRAAGVDALKAANIAEILALFQSLPDADGDGHIKVSLGGGDCDDLNPLIHPGATEVCDRVDNNCDGHVDEGFANIWYYDGDGDGYGGVNSAVVSCDSVPGYISTGGDCDDSNASTYPGAEEICDLQDNNCDGVSDVVGWWRLDEDGDGFGSEGVFFGCYLPGYTTEGGDCDDSNPAVNPDAEESCDGIDNDCDGIVDNNTPGCTVYYRDQDQDGYGATGEEACLCAPIPPYTATQAGDCDDFNPNVNPGVPEDCGNSLDDDCDEEVNEGAHQVYQDADGDGFGNIEVWLIVCETVPGYVDNSLDCDDTEPSVYPGAPELCDFLDNNCNGQIDEGMLQTYYFDNDGDGYGDPNVTVQSCLVPPGYLILGGDCDDNDPEINPGAYEIPCNGVDENCDGEDNCE